VSGVDVGGLRGSVGGSECFEAAAVFEIRKFAVYDE